jgi:hypothetical protein
MDAETGHPGLGVGGLRKEEPLQARWRTGGPDLVGRSSGKYSPLTDSLTDRRTLRSLC